MKHFLREYWLWILIPFVLMALFVGALLLFGDPDAANPFRYNQ